MYVELYGPTTKQNNSMPAIVHLELRHGSASFFKNGGGQIKEFRQKLALFRKFTFNRFAITDEARCNQEISRGNSK